MDKFWDGFLDLYNYWNKSGSFRFYKKLAILRCQLSNN